MYKSGLDINACQVNILDGQVKNNFTCPHEQIEPENVNIKKVIFI